MSTRSNSLIILLCITLISISIVCISGCASVALPSDMIPTTLPAQPNIGESASIVVVGKQRHGDQSLSKETFAKAVDLTLTQKGVFREIVDSSEEPDFRLEITIVHYEVKVGTSFFHKTHSALTVDWKLFKENEQMPLWEEVITTSYGVKNKPFWVALEESTEQACKKNIEKAVLQLSKLASPNT